MRYVNHINYPDEAIITVLVTDWDPTPFYY